MPRRVLIVDDEPFIREMIGAFIAESGTGYQVAGEAINGRLALDFLAENHVDLIVTDIKMPVMDGIDFIREAARLGCSAGIVVLSAYDEFHLVKEAFKLGARDYLLKSEITREELFGVLRRVSVDGEGRSRLLLRILEGRSDPGCPDLEDLGLSGGEGNAEYRVLCIRLLPAEGPPAERKTGSPLREVIQRCLRELGEGETVFTECGNGSAAFLVTGRRAEGLFAALSDSLKEEGADIAGGLSNPSRDPSAIQDLYRQAVLASACYFFRGRGKLISYAAVASLERSPVGRDYSGKVDELRRLLGLRNSAQMSEGIRNFCVHPQHPSPAEMEAIRGLFTAYHGVLSKAVLEEPEELSSPVRARLSEFETRVRERGTLDEYNRWIRTVLEEYCAVLNSRSRIVRKAVELISNNYTKDIRLSDAARRLEVSESYLSRIFSREMNCGFVSYLSKVRIEKALGLLKTTELKIYEIAEKTGYPNTEHFNRTFKKLLGRSPKEYR